MNTNKSTTTKNKLYTTYKVNFDEATNTYSINRVMGDGAEDLTGVSTLKLKYAHANGGHIRKVDTLDADGNVLSTKWRACMDPFRNVKPVDQTSTDNAKVA